MIDIVKCGEKGQFYHASDLRAEYIPPILAVIPTCVIAKLYVPKHLGIRLDQLPSLHLNDDEPTSL
jgi:hypothetical protein